MANDFPSSSFSYYTLILAINTVGRHICSKEKKKVAETQSCLNEKELDLLIFFHYLLIETCLFDSVMYHLLSAWFSCEL